MRFRHTFVGAVGIAAFASGVAIARPVTVTVNDRPLNVAALVEDGHVLVPMRAIFEALAASVTYDAQNQAITAATPSHRIRLRLGSRVAFVDGRSTPLESPARVIALTTYVPLRFVAQALGAAVGYDAQHNLVAIVAARNAARVDGLSPPSDASVATAYPAIGASLADAAARQSDVSLRLDGTDVTILATFDGTTITYIPRTSLQRGSHTVSFGGTDTAGRQFEQTWSFQTTVAGNPEYAEPGAAPGEVTPYQFYTPDSSAYRAGDWMHFVLIAPPGGSAYLQLCGLGLQYPFWNGGNGTLYQANVPAPLGYIVPSCQVTAVYTAWNGRQTYVPYPVFVGIYTRPTPRPNPSATPAPNPRHIEPIGRRPAPAITPLPTPIATPHRTPVPAPQPTAPAMHSPLPRTPLPIRAPHPKATPN